MKYLIGLLFACTLHAQTMLDNPQDAAADAAFFAHPPQSSIASQSSPSPSPSAIPEQEVLQNNHIDSNQGLPWPIEGHSFTLAEINEFRDQLVGDVVWVKLSPTYFQPEPDGSESKLFVKDAVDTAVGEGYAFVWFPQEGAQKMNLIGKTLRGWLSFYVKIEPDKLTAIGRSKHIFIDENFRYTW